jgi:hypothetical protein
LTGYEVASLTDTLAKAKNADVTVLVAPFTVENRDSAVVQFPRIHRGSIRSDERPAGGSASWRRSR